MNSLPQVTYFMESREQADLAIKSGETNSRGEFLQRANGSPEQLYLFALNGLPVILRMGEAIKKVTA